MTDTTKYETADVRMSRAFEKLGADEDLRFFLRSLLAMTGEGTTPFNSNALQMAYANGRHSIGTDLLTNMRIHTPKLYIGLLSDDLIEQNRTNQKDENYET